MSAAKPMWQYCLRISCRPSADSEALKSGKSRRHCATALIRKGSSVSFCSEVDSALRKASRSVISALSVCVTCGTSSQLRCRFCAEMRRMRDRSTASTGPKRLKSTSGCCGIPPPEPAAAACGAAFMADFTCCWTSSRRMRPLAPLPLTCVRSTPSSRANRRTAGLACGMSWPSPSGRIRGPWAADASPAASAFGAGAASFAAAGAGSGAAACVAGAASALPATRSSQMASPSLSLSSTFTATLATVPAIGAGTSIVDFSDSSTISGWSASTVSPSLTNTSMTGTSVKSPMSGTRTVSTRASAAGSGSGSGSGWAAGSDDGSGSASAAGSASGSGAGSADAASAGTSWQMVSPSETLSSTFSATDSMVPASGAGISIVDLSDSSTISGCSASTVSPGLTSTSMTGTSLKPPISGTLTGLALAIRKASGWPWWP